MGLLFVDVWLLGFCEFLAACQLKVITPDYMVDIYIKKLPVKTV